MPLPHNGAAVAEYIAAAGKRALPPEVAEMARLCLADWLGVAIGAAEEPAGRIVREVAAGWHGEGPSRILVRGTAAAPFPALASGTLAHCLDFDDTYVRAITHTSAPVWAASLAVGEQIGADESTMLSAFVAGVETAAAASVLLRLDNERTLHALGAAATQTGGLTASFGTMAKPFHAGKAAMDGVVAAQLPARGFSPATGVVE